MSGQGHGETEYIYERQRHAFRRRDVDGDLFENHLRELC